MEKPYYLPLALSPGAEPPKVIGDDVFYLAVRVQAHLEERGAVPVCENLTAFEALVQHREDLWEEKAVENGEDYCEPYPLPISLMDLFSLIVIADSADKWKHLPEYLVTVGMQPLGSLGFSDPIEFPELGESIHRDLGSARLSIFNVYTSKVHIPRGSQGS
jgi:hypothetical protein